MGIEVVEDSIRVNENEYSDFLMERAISPWKHMTGSNAANATVDYCKVFKQICCFWSICKISEKIKGTYEKH